MKTPQEHKGTTKNSPLCLCAFVVLTLLGLGLLAPMALVVLAYDGFFALLAIVATTSAALWLIPVLRLEPLPLRWHLLIAVALGLGGLALLVLGLGLVGVLQRSLWIGILLALGVVGATRVRVLWAQARAARARQGNGSDGSGAWNWLMLLVVPFAVLALDVATVPPGFLWRDEGYGYDALEYHLGLPKEYLSDQRVAYMPHNVYANFPANVEMLYLLSMLLRGDAVDGAMTGQMFNLAFAVLTVAAVWVAGREWSTKTAALATVLLGTVGWLPFLCGVAFVENGMLFFTAVACAALLRGAREGSGFRVQGSEARSPLTGALIAHRSPALRWIMLAGVFAGLATGCKYTGITLVALPIGIAVILLPASRLPLRVKRGAIFALAALLAFAPWLMKNEVFTGNPVFPLANKVFRAYPPGWGEPESRHFDECHRPRPHERPLAARLKQFWRHVIADEHGLYGALLLLAPLVLIVAISTGRDKTAPMTRIPIALLASILAVQLLAWLFGTHLYARFAVVIIVPLALLGAIALGALRGAARSALLIALLTILVGVNLARFAALYQAHFYVSGQRQAIEGATEAFQRGTMPGFDYLATINELPASARVLILGEARAFYVQRAVDYYVVFNRNPFVEVVRAGRSPREIVDWLRQHGYTHVLVNWSEIARLRRSAYGYPAEVQPELFAALIQAGLRHVQTFVIRELQHPYADLYEVSP